MGYFSMSIVNSRDEELRLTGNPNYTVTRIDGLNPPNANINTSPHATFDGSTFNSSRVETRNIVIEFAIEGDAEANRIALYRYIKTKKPLTFRFQNGRRSVYIEGYVETFEVGFFDEKQVAQVSLICPRPYFIDDEFAQSTFSSVIALFEFPFSIETPIPFSELDFEAETNVVNGGDVDTGMLIRFWATGNVVNPTLYNTDRGEYLRVNLSMSRGDLIEVNTVSGEKSITLTSSGVTTNALNYLDAGSTWLTLESGDNTFSTGADEHPENLACTLWYSNLYEGV